MILKMNKQKEANRTKKIFTKNLHVEYEMNKTR